MANTGVDNDGDVVILILTLADQVEMYVEGARSIPLFSLRSVCRGRDTLLRIHDEIGCFAIVNLLALLFLFLLLLQQSELSLFLEIR